MMTNLRLRRFRDFFSWSANSCAVLGPSINGQQDLQASWMQNEIGFFQSVCS
jgi:hypothetical protein